MPCCGADVEAFDVKRVLLIIFSFFIVAGAVVYLIFNQGIYVIVACVVLIVIGLIGFFSTIFKSRSGLLVFMALNFLCVFAAIVALIIFILDSLKEGGFDNRLILPIVVFFYFDITIYLTHQLRAEPLKLIWTFGLLSGWNIIFILWYLFR